MRKPWKKLIIKFVDTFFSKSVLCKMDESIDDLEGHKRTPDAMGKDIFKVNGLQEAVKKLLEANPGLGVKPLLAKLREKQLYLGAGNKEVREALKAVKAKIEAKKQQEANEKKGADEKIKQSTSTEDQAH